MEFIRFRFEDDFFLIMKNKVDSVAYRKRRHPFSYYENNINFNDYYIYKSSGNFKEVSIEEFKEFKYAGYIFFHKELYSNIEMNESIEYLYSLGLSFNYFNKPLPPLNILQKIKVIDGFY